MSRKDEIESSKTTINNQTDEIGSEYIKLIRQQLKQSIENENIYDVIRILQLVFLKSKFRPRKRPHFCLKPDFSNFYVDKDRTENAFHYACRLGKTCLVDVLLDSGYFSVNNVTNSIQRNTPLCIACDWGCLDTAKLLIARGSDCNYENGEFKTPLILATELVSPYDIEMCKLLLKNGALVNKCTRKGNTALLSASKYGNVKLIRLLVSANANVNWKFTDGANALMRACYYNHYDLVKYLLENGAELDAKNLRGETALYIAAFKGHIELVKLLVDKYKADVNSRDLDGDTALSVSCYENHHECISFLLSQGAECNTYGLRKDTPLHIAASDCSINVISELIIYGANVDALNNENETPLHLIATLSRMNELSLLLEYAKDLDVRSYSSNKTPLRCLFENINMEKVIMGIRMIKAGCDIQEAFLDSKSSPFELLFRIKKKLVVKEIVDETTIYFRMLADFADLIVKSGYRPVQNDYKLFKNSWLYSYETVRLNFENILGPGVCHKPKSLLDQSRISIRKCLCKPLKISISSLYIPDNLKSFLYFN